MPHEIVRTFPFKGPGIAVSLLGRLDVSDFSSRHKQTGHRRAGLFGSPPFIFFQKAEGPETQARVKGNKKGRTCLYPESRYARPLKVIPANHLANEFWLGMGLRPTHIWDSVLTFGTIKKTAPET
jgi:hypothetical protein